MPNYTPKLGFVKQAVGENPTIWGSVENSSFIDLTDEAIAGRADIDLSGGDVTLTIEDGASSDGRHMVLRFIGAPVLPVDVVVPQRDKLYVLDNQCGQTVTVRTSTGIGADVEDSEIVIAMVDEALNRVSKLVQHDQNIVPTYQGDLDGIASTINSVSAGTSNVTVYTMDEGNGFKTFRFPPVQFVDGTTTSFIAAITINPDSGVYPVASREVSIPIFVRVGSTHVLSHARFTSTAITVRRSDSGNLGAAGSAIEIPEFTFTMANAPNA